MSGAIIFYFAFFGITLGLTGLFYALARARFGKQCDHTVAMWNATRNSLRLLAVAGVISILVLNYDLFPSKSVTYLCVPFFAILTYEISNFFRILNHYNMVNGKK